MKQTKDLSPILGGYFLQITDTFFMTLEGTSITYANEASARVLEKEVNDLIGGDITSFVIEAERDDFKKRLDEINERTDYFMVHITAPLSATIELKCRLVPLILNDKKLVMMEAVDEAPLIALKKKNAALEEKVSHMSPLDLETLLPSPVLLNDRIEQAILRALREARGDLTKIQSYLTLIAVNVEGLNQISEKFGAEGKRYVMDILVSRFKSSIRSVDTLAKGQDDYFYFLFENIRDKENIKIITNRLQNCVNVPILYKDQSIKFSINLGVSVYPDNGTSAVALVKWAKLNPIKND